MFGNIVVLVILCAFLALFGYLGRRAWRSRRALVRWPALFVLGLLALAGVLITVLGTIGMIKTYAPRGNPVIALTVDRTPEQIARGEHIAASICAACHSADEQLPLSGGHNLLEDVPMPLGNFTPPNLTPGGRVKDWSDGELLRAIREGTYPNGHLMPVMASNNFAVLSKEDLHAVIAYVRGQPAVDTVSPRETISFLSLIFVTIGFFPTKPVPAPEPPPAIARAATAEYGKYIADFIECSGCHGQDLTGGEGGLAPQGPSLRVVKGWSFDQFKTTLRTGVNPSGKPLDPDKMPWKFIGRLDDVELSALYAYLGSLN